MGRLLALVTVGSLVLAAAAGAGGGEVATGRSTFHVTTTSDSHDARPGKDGCRDAQGRCSLRAALEEATVRGGAHVLLAPGVYVLSFGELVLGARTWVRIDGAGAVIDGDHKSRILENDGLLFVLDMTFRSGDATAEDPALGRDGGAIRNLGSLDLKDVSFQGNLAQQGGAISNRNEISIFGDVRFEENTASGVGGAIFNRGGLSSRQNAFGLYARNVAAEGGAIRNDGTVFATGGRFEENSARGNGGAVSNAGAINLSRAFYVNNRAGVDGGAIANSGTLWLRDTRQISGNSARNGGGIANRGTATVNGISKGYPTTFAGNSSSGRGGGIDNTGEFEGRDLSFDGNAARVEGGAIANTGTFTLGGSTHSSNHADGNGGAVLNQGSMTLGGDLTGNSGLNGGAIRNEGELHLHGSASGNQANGRGGAISNTGALDATHLRLKGNSSALGGGGLSNSGTTTFTTFRLVANTTGGDGGAIESRQGSFLTLMEGTLSGNGAAGDGGALALAGQAALDTLTIDHNNATGKGGAIENTGGKICCGLYQLASNLTISHNQAGTGLGNAIDTSAGGYSGLANATINNNFSQTATDPIAIRNVDASGAVTELVNTIVARNPGQNCDGTITSGGHNLASTSRCHLDGPGDLFGLDPLLAGLRDNGGSILTEALLPGSPAVDAADCPPPATDARGVSRPQGPACDIGAYEAQP